MPAWTIEEPEPEQGGRWVITEPATTPPVRRNRDHIGGVLRELATLNPVTAPVQILRRVSDRDQGRAGAFATGVLDSSTFGFGDELRGVEAGIGRMLGGGSYAEGYQPATRAARDRINQASGAHPFSFGAGQLGGAFAGGAGSGAAVRGGIEAIPAAAGLVNRAGLLGRLGGSAVGGAAGFGAYNAGTMEGDVEERARAGAEGLVPGALLGLGGQAILGEALPHVLGRFGRMFSPEAGAINEIGDAARRFEVDDATLENNLERVAPFGGTLADAMPGGTSLTAGAGVRPSVERVRTREALDQRNNAMGREAIEDIWRTLAPRSNFRSAGDAIYTTREMQAERAAPLYERAFAVPVRAVAPEVREVMRRNPRLFETAVARARDGILSETGQEASESMPQYWARVLEEVNANFRQHLRAAKMGSLDAYQGRIVRDYGLAVDQFDSSVRRMLGRDFADAQDLYSGDASFMDAVSDGAEAFGPGADDIHLTEVARRLQRARERGQTGVLEAHRIGALSAIQDAIQNADSGTGRADVLRSIMRSEGQRRVWRALFGEGEDVEALMRRMDVRRELYRNSAETGIATGSQTAPLIAARESQEARSLAGGLGRDNIMRLLTGGAVDRYQEQVSNNILREMRRPASEVLAELRGAGGYSQWANRRKGLVARALADRAERGDSARRFGDALAGFGLYGGIGGDVGLSASTGQGY